jgi:hypothetical protein
MAAELIQLYYQQDQKKELYPFAVPHFNTGLTIFFENYWIRELVPSTRAEKIAVCSWKLRDKMKHYVGRPRELTLEVLNSDYQVLTFTRNPNHVMLRAAEHWHPGFLNVFDKILKAIGLKRPHEVRIPIYQNHFSATVSIYQDYVERYLSPAMDCITNDKEINALAMRDSKYGDLTHQSGEVLREKLGIGYWPMAPFLLERLFSVYVHNEKIDVTYL